MGSNEILRGSNLLWALKNSTPFPVISTRLSRQFRRPTSRNFLSDYSADSTMAEALVVADPRCGVLGGRQSTRTCTHMLLEKATFGS